jgi:prepilin peptidase CpaA
MLDTFLTAILPTLVIAAAATDFASYRIPNWLTISTAALFIPAAVLAGMDLQTFMTHLGTGAFLFFIGFLLFSLRVFGGGDAKLMAAAGLWLGFNQTSEFLIYTVLIGGPLAIAVTLATWLSMHLETRGSKLGEKIKKFVPDVPYGIALAVGAILAFPHSWWMVGNA